MADKKFIARNGLAVGNNVSVIETTGVITAGNTTVTGDLTVNNYVIAANGATSAYATKYLVEYNPTTKDLTYSSKPDASRPYITGYGQEIHVSPVALDDTGNGTIGDPVKTIAQALVLVAAAFETTSAGERKTIILHPGDYAANVTIDTQFLVLTTHESVGKNTTLSGTLTINKGCTIDGLKMTNLVIAANSSVGTVDLIGCTVATATTKTAGAYTVFRACDLSSSTLNITGGGSVVMVGGNYGNVTVANTSAGVLAKAVVTMGPTTLTSGTMQISDTLVYAASNTASAITQSAGSILTLNNSQTLIPDLSNVARNTFGGFYSILHSVYDKTNSTFGGTSLAAVDHGQHLNIDKLIVGNTTVNVAITSTAITSNATLAIGNTTVTGFANVSSTLQVGGNVVLSSTTGISANGSVGSAGQGLVSNGSAVYWSNNPGYTGSTGATGFTGSTGAQGPIGFTGSLGAQGPIGFTGSLGAQGPIGFTGSLGAQGPIGFTGSLGAQGPQGATGPQGPIGFTGSLGAQGPIGFTGSQGAQGAQGPQGATGPQGPIGFTGSLGAQGPQGATGPQGPIGFTGSLGAQGPQGATGPQGPIGFTGSLGAQGPQGATGPQGPAGPTGPQGPIGFTGSLGAQGPAGPTGPQGPQGAQGAQGATGPTGFTGSTGLTSGDQTLAGVKTFSSRATFSDGMRIGPTPGDPNAFIVTRTMPAGDPNVGNEATELLLFHANDPANGSGPDFITLRAPALRFQTYDNASVDGPDVSAGWNNRLTISQTGVITSSVDFRAPIFYDSNNTAYYIDPASTSILVNMSLGGGQTVNGQSHFQWEGATYRNPGDHTPGLLVRADNATAGINGSRPAISLYNENGGDQTTVAMAFVSREQSGAGNAVNLAGIVAKKQIAGTSGDWTQGSLTFYTRSGGTRNDAIFIDQSGFVTIGGNEGQNAFNSTTGRRLMFGGGDSDAQSNYYIGTNLENYGGNYNKLDLRWHTGIRMGAQAGYGGIRFYDSEDLGTQVFAINKDGAYAQANQSMRAPIFYDLDNTAYYMDPLGTTSLLGNLYVARSGVSNDVFGGLELREYSYAGAATGAANEAPGVNFHWSARAAARIYMNAAGNFVFGGQTDITNNRRDIIFASGYATTRVDAPIFRDSDDTARFFNGAGGINFLTGTSNRVNIYSDDSGFYVNNAEGNAGLLRLGAAYSLTGVYVNPSLYLQSENTIFFRTQNVERAAINSSGVLTVGGDVRAPLFYDINDTTYYTNPASSSVMSSIALGGATSVPQGVIWANGNIWLTGGTRKVAFSTDSSTDDGGNVSLFASGNDFIVNNWSGAALNDNFYVFGASRDAAVVGNMTAYYSDERLKTKTGIIDNALGKVMSLEGFTYIENELARLVGYNNRKQQVGLSAQKVKAVLPEAVALAPFDYDLQDDGTIVSKSGEDYLTVDYSRLVPLLIEAIKEQQTHINKLEDKINSIQNKRG